jgi:hypothetical protein
VIHDSRLEDLYSSKTDDELLALAADDTSLREDAKPLLAHELQRRNLQPPISKGNSSSTHSTTRALVFGVALIINSCIAFLCTPLLERGIGMMFHAHSFAALLWKWWTLDPIFAAGLGFSVYRLWKTNAAAWTWVLPALWFGLRFIPAVLSGDNQSVMATRSVWSQFSGAECADGLHALGCRNFMLFTLPFVRGVFYSLGAYLSVIVTFQPKHVAAAAVTTNAAEPR